MNVKLGNGKTKYGPGVGITMSGDEVAVAIDAYLVANSLIVRGARTITVNGELCGKGEIYVDPSGFVISDGEKFSADGSCMKPDTTLTAQIGDLVDELMKSIRYNSNDSCIQDDVEMTLKKAFIRGRDHAEA